MKHLLTNLLLVAAIAFGVSPAWGWDLYIAGQVKEQGGSSVVGWGNGSSPSVKVSSKSDDCIYLQTTGYFKVSTVNNTNWNDFDNGVLGMKTTGENQTASSSNRENANSGYYSYHIKIWKDGSDYKYTTSDKEFTIGSGNTGTYTYELHSWGSGDKDIEFTNGVLKSNQLSGQSFGIRVKENGSQKFWYHSADGSPTAVSATGTTTFTLVRESNGNGASNISMPTATGEFTFTLTLDSDGMPTKLVVEAPQATPPATSKVYIYGNMEGGTTQTLGTWTNAKAVEMTKNADGSYTADITWNAEEAKFRFWNTAGNSNENGNQDFGPDWQDASASLTSSNNNKDISNYSNRGAWKVSKGTYTVTLASDFKTFTITKQGGEETLKVYLRGDDFGGWESTSNELTKGADGIYSLTTTFNANKEFKVYLSNGIWVGADADKDHNLLAPSNNQFTKKWEDLTIKYDPKTGQVSFDYPQVTPPVSDVPDALYIFANRDGTNGNYVNLAQMEKSADGKYFSYTIDYHGSNEKAWFRFHTKNGSTWDYVYGRGNSNYNESSMHMTLTDNTKTLVKESGDANLDRNFSFSDANNGLLTFTVSFAGDEPTVTITRPAAEFAKVYLKGKYLNNGRISPAWEMTKTGEDTYEITNFAMRRGTSLADGEFGVEGRDKNGNKMTLTATVKGSLPSWDYGSKVNDQESTVARQPGWAYRATYNSTTNELTFRPMSSETYTEEGDILPYIGLLGMNFKQEKDYNTPRSGEPNTKDGWQEAFIEYNANGVPEKDKDGNVYYNTVWPPRNNIMLQNKLGTDANAKTINITTDDMTLKLDKAHGKMKGSDWLKLFEGDSKYEHLELEADKEYYRYASKGMWVAGKFKLWTGWAGRDRWDNGTQYAQWDNNTCWGPGSEDKEFGAGSTYKCTSDKDFYTHDNAAEYFNSMELFVPFVDGKVQLHGDNASRLYLTEANGGAQIQSFLEQAKESSTGTLGYLPELTTELPGSYKVSSYKVGRYAFDAAGSHELIEVVAEDSGLSLSKDEFNALWTKETGKDYVKDADNVAAGRYIYNLTVTFSETDKEDRTGSVWSTYQRIVNTDLDIDLSVRQIIELDAEDNFGGYAYLTYSSSNDGYLVKKNEEGHITEVVRLSKVTEDKEAASARVYNTTGTWTNDKLIIYGEPEEYLEGTSKEEIIKFEVNNEENTLVADYTHGDKMGGYFVSYFETTDNSLEPHTYTATFNAKIYEGDVYQRDCGEKTKSVTYTPTFMLPSLGEPKMDIQVSEHDVIKATHEHIDGQWTSQRSTYTDDVNDENYDPDVTYEEWEETNTVAANELTVTVPIVMPKFKEDLATAVQMAMHISVNGVEATIDGAATEYALVYRNQSPYNWLAADGDAWTAKNHDWTLTGSYGEGVNTLAPANPTATLNVKPQFGKPELEGGSTFKILVAMDNCEGIYDKEGNEVAEFTIALEKSNIKDIDMLFGEESMEQSDLYIVNPTFEDVLSSEISWPYEIILDHKLMDRQLPDDQINTHGIFTMKMPAKYLTGGHKYDEANAEYWDAFKHFANEIYPKIVKNLKVELGPVSFFKSQVAGEDGKVYTSGFKGFKTEIANAVPPTSMTAPAEGPARKPSMRGATTELQGDDNAYLFAPVYSDPLTLDDIDIVTGVRELMAEMAGTDTEYYDLQGQRVKNPGRGLYIRVKDGKADKVMR